MSSGILFPFSVLRSHPLFGTLHLFQPVLLVASLTVVSILQADRIMAVDYSETRTHSVDAQGDRLVVFEALP